MSSSFTLNKFKELCDDLTFQVIGRKVTAIHPYFLMVPTKNEINIVKDAIIEIADSVGMYVHGVIFAIAVYRFGMSVVLCRRDINIEGLGRVFTCFLDPESRLEIARYYALQMLRFREDLRYQPNYVDILLKSAVKSRKVIEVLTLNVNDAKDIVLFCGLSMYTLLMACTPSAIFEDERNAQIITKCQLERILLRDGDLNAFFSHDSPKAMSAIITETQIDAWGNTGDDCMENIFLLLDAAADGSPSLGHHLAMRGQ